MAVKIDKTLKVENLLTIVALAGSVAAFTVSWSKERKLSHLQRADRVQHAAATAIAKLDRWQRIQLSLHEHLQPTVVQTTRQLVDQFDVPKARDSLWSAMEQRAALSQPVLDEAIDTGYVELLAFRPTFRAEYAGTLKALRAVESDAFGLLQDETQKAVLGYVGRQRESYVPAELGNLLREAVGQYRARLLQGTDQILEASAQPLLTLIKRSAETSQD